MCSYCENVEHMNELGSADWWRDENYGVSADEEHRNDALRLSVDLFEGVFVNFACCDSLLDLEEGVISKF